MLKMAPSLTELQWQLRLGLMCPLSSMLPLKLQLRPRRQLKPNSRRSRRTRRTRRTRKTRKTRRRTKLRRMRMTKMILMRQKPKLKVTQPKLIVISELRIHSSNLLSILLRVNSNPSPICKAKIPRDIISKISIFLTNPSKSQSIPFTLSLNQAINSSKYASNQKPIFFYALQPQFTFILLQKSKMSSRINKQFDMQYNEQANRQCKSLEFPMPTLDSTQPKHYVNTKAMNTNEKIPSSHLPPNKEAKLENNEQLSGQTFWGNVKAYSFDPATNTPKIIITQHLLRSLALNLLIISILCIAIPILTNRNMFNQVLTPAGRNRLLQQAGQPSQSMGEQRNLAAASSVSISPRYVARKYSIYIFSGIWTGYELIFLAILLLSNPGYGDPLAQRQISLEEQNEIAQFPQKHNLQGYNRCQICKSIVDNSVFHCPTCNLCCQGFSHHCEWIGKCVGYRNEIFLNAYYYGFFGGTLTLVLLILLQSIPSQ